MLVAEYPEPRDDDTELVPAGLLYGLMLRFDLLQEQEEGVPLPPPG